MPLGTDLGAFLTMETTHQIPAELVLIPILMDYPLGAQQLHTNYSRYVGLNPYSNGLPSRGGGRKL